MNARLPAAAERREGARALTAGTLADDVWAAGLRGDLDGQHDPEDVWLDPLFPFGNWTLGTRDPATDRVLQAPIDLAPAGSVPTRAARAARPTELCSGGVDPHRRRCGRDCSREGRNGHIGRHRHRLQAGGSPPAHSRPGVGQSSEKRRYGTPGWRPSPARGSWTVSTTEELRQAFEAAEDAGHIVKDNLVDTQSWEPK
ncbi:MAG TPA: hypothetical protein PLD23_06310 [Armatimonadota bacterium]|nr:hypothetical protein [Armatimonadota bacterium]HQK93097.1 hypothetical protein [Armatimonadota bacterium]